MLSSIRHWYLRFLAFVAVPLLVAAVAFVTPLSADDGSATQEETFRALAQHLGSGPSGQTSIIITISRWSTDEERDHLAEVLVTEDMQDLADELRRQETVGFIRTTGRAARVGTGSWQLRYAREFRSGDDRIIRLATDRPISFVEVLRQPVRTWDFQVSIIELKLDANDEGEGVLMAGVEFGVDGENNVLTIKHVSTNPVRLVNVRK